MKIIFQIIALSFCTSVTGFSQTEDLWLDFKNDEIRFKYPSNWVLKERVDKDSVVIFSFYDKNETQYNQEMLNAQFLLSDLRHARLSEEEFIDNIERIIKENSNDNNVIVLENKILNRFGVNVYKYMIVDMSEIVPSKQLFFAWIKQENAYGLAFKEAATIFDENLSNYLEIFESVELPLE